MKLTKWKDVFKDVFKYSLKCSKTVKTLLTKTSVQLSSKGEVTIVSGLLFQRLAVLANRCSISFVDYKRHELCVYWCQNRGMKYTGYVISNLTSVSVAFDGYPENLIPNNNTHKCVWEKEYLQE